MSAVERYAIRFLESSGNYITLEQIKAAKVSKITLLQLFFSFKVRGEPKNFVLRLDYWSVVRFVEDLLLKIVSAIEMC